jgi:peptide/nickel transport system permease protein
MAAAGIFAGIVVVNYGGYIDQIREAEIGEALNGLSLQMRGATPEELQQATQETRWAMEEAYGLHQPFLVRCGRWFVQAMTFDWGKTRFLTLLYGSSSQQPSVRDIILERLPNTLLLAGAANVLLLVTSIGLAVSLARRHGSLLDRLVITLSPISSVPNWVYGILLIVILAGELHLLPFGGMFDEFPPANKIGYVPIVLKHMLLPVLAILLSTFFQTVYTWRTYLLIQSTEDYVELARAKGLPARLIDRRYVLRPALPYIVTSFALMLIGFWQSILVLELVFRWPGIGQLFITAIRRQEQGVSVGLIVLLALLIAVSVFVLDIVYAIVDPRVKVGGRRTSVKMAAAGARRFRPSLRGLWPVRRRRAAGARPGIAGVPSTRPSSAGPSVRRADWGQRLRSLGQVLRYPSALIGLAIIIFLIGVAVHTVITLPYDEAVERWRPEAVGKYRLPKNAMPEWVNLFRRDPLPATVIQNSADGQGVKTIEPGTNGTTRTRIEFSFDHDSTSYPEDVAIYFTPHYTDKRPFVTLTWLTPDGRQLDLGSFSIVTGRSYIASQDLPAKYVRDAKARQSQLLAGSGGYSPAVLLFASQAAERPAAVPGKYTLRIDALTFEENASVDAELVVWGQVYGWAGTDDQRRDLSVALLWGTPVALLFGFLGAIATSVFSMTIAAVGVWFDGWVDDLIQRLTEINMILPALPIAIMIYFLYSNSLWAMLGVIVVLSIFGSAIKSYRAAFLQIKESGYVEAAVAYGAGNWRLVRHYLVPRIMPLLIPQLVTLIPTYVFFEATLAYLQISDPNLPTWGKVVYDALTAGAYQGHYYWVLEPLALMMITGLAFAMVGFALDALLNPRLRRM